MSAQEQLLRATHQVGLVALGCPSPSRLSAPVLATGDSTCNKNKRAPSKLHFSIHTTIWPLSALS